MILVSAENRPVYLVSDRQIDRYMIFNAEDRPVYLVSDRQTDMIFNVVNYGGYIRVNLVSGCTVSTQK